MYRLILLALGLIALLVGPAPLFAASPCPISLMQGGDIGAVDGSRGPEWDDASVLQSLSPATNACLGTLLDDDGTFRAVSIRSKTYTDGSGADWISLFLEVQDSSETQPGGTTLANGEVLVLQLDPDLSEGSELGQGADPAARDWKIELRHFWESVPGGSDPAEVATTLRIYDSSGDSPFCAVPPATSLPSWNEVVSGLTPATTPQAAVRKDLPGGYSVEIAVPMALIGAPTGDIGIALAIVNDHGACGGGSGVCDGYGLAFPSDLPVTNADNPVLGCGYGWLAPDRWATGYVESAPGDVTLSHNPRFWTSEDVDALACGTVDNNFYPGDPCRLSVRANLRNASPSDQIRNLLVLRGDHGAGVVDWSFVDLIEGVSVPAGGQFASVSAEDSDLQGLSGHPCVRAYALPPTLDPGFDLARMQSIAGAADLVDLVASYGLRDEHFAQQNITRRPAAESCPDAACSISAWLNQRVDPVVGGLRFIRPALAQEAGQDPVASPQDPVASPQDPVAAPERALFTLAPAAHAQAGAQQTGILTNLSDDIGLDRETLAGISKANAVVEFVALGYREPDNIEPPLPDPRHNFLEVVGGAVELIPLERIREGERIDLTLNIGNPSDAMRHIGVSVRLHDPTGSGVVLAVDAQTQQAITGRVFDPYEARPLQVVAGLEEVIGNGPGSGLTYWQVLLILLLVLLVAAILWQRRRAV